MKQKIFISVAIILLMLSSGAMAFDVQIVPGSLPYDATGQTTVYFDVVFNSDLSGNTLGGLVLNFYYDNVELTWNSLLSTPGPLPSPLVPGAFGGPFETTSGKIENFNAGLQPSTATAPTVTGSLVLGTIAFDVAPGINAPSPDSFSDVWFDTSSPGTGFTIDGNNISMSAMSVNTGPDVYAATVVPEPVSSTLFIIGGATLGFIRFRKKFKR